MSSPRQGQAHAGTKGLSTPVSLDISPPTPAFPVAVATTIREQEEEEKFPLSPARWYMLFLFCLLSCNQGISLWTLCTLSESKAANSLPL